MIDKKQFGIFEWRGDGRYQHSTAVAIYQREHSAQVYATKLNQKNPIYVVRTIYS
jgi:hypothetical protein